MNRRDILKSMLGAMAAAAGVVGLAPAARAQTKHIRLYVEMDVDPAREREMLDLFHSQFVPEAVKHDGYMRVKLLKRRTDPSGHGAGQPQLPVRARVRERRAASALDCLARPPARVAADRALHQDPGNLSRRVVRRDVAPPFDACLSKTDTMSYEDTTR